MAAKISKEKSYKVDLAKSIRVGRLIVNPGPNTRLNGETLQVIIDQDKSAVKNYEAI